MSSIFFKKSEKQRKSMQTSLFAYYIKSVFVQNANANTAPRARPRIGLSSCPTSKVCFMHQLFILLCIFTFAIPLHFFAQIVNKFLIYAFVLDFYWALVYNNVDNNFERT